MKQLYKYKPGSNKPERVAVNELKDTSKEVYCFENSDDLRPSRRPLDSKCAISTGTLYTHEGKRPNRGTGLVTDWKGKTPTSLLAARLRNEISSDSQITDARTTTFGLSLPRYLFSIITPTGKMVCVALSSGSLNALIVDLEEETATTTNFGIDSGLPANTIFESAVLCPNGKIYCAPSSAIDKILILDVENETAQLKDFGLDLTGDIKFDGGILSNNGLIYFIPANFPEFLVVDPRNDEAWLTDFGFDLSATAKFRGGALGLDNKLYCSPNLATPSTDREFLFVVDTNTQTASYERFGLDESLTINSSGRGALTPRGNLLLPRIGGNRFHKINFSETSNVITLDPIPLGITMGIPGFSTGVIGPDGKIYIAPLNENQFAVYNEDSGTVEFTNFGLTLPGTIRHSNISLYKNKLIAIPSATNAGDRQFVIIEFDHELSETLYLDRRINRF